MSGKTYQTYVDEARALGFTADALADAAALSRGFLARMAGLGKVPDFKADLALNLGIMNLQMKRDETLHGEEAQRAVSNHEGLKQKVRGSRRGVAAPHHEGGL